MPAARQEAENFVEYTLSDVMGDERHLDDLCLHVGDDDGCYLIYVNASRIVGKDLSR